jgi:phenylpropionate dioxygenase-like ring-hydroxylating dioxygenase large terminal subunit
VNRAGKVVLASAMAEVAARDHQLGLEELTQHGRAAFDRVVVARAEMQVRQVENACKHRGGRL